MITLWRMIVFGVQSFWRNIWLSLITVIILVLNLFLISLVFGLNILGQQTLVAVRNKVDVSAYFTATTSEDRVEQVRQDLLKKPEVASAKVVSRAQRLEEFKRSKDKPTQQAINQALQTIGENPLGPGLIIKAKTLDGYSAIISYLQAPEYQGIVEDVGNEFRDKQRVIDRLSAIVRQVQRATVGLTFLFALIALLMVFNTIRITIYAHREEIGIMKLVGASDAFVRGPFVVTSILYGLTASIVTAVILVPILSRLNPFFTQFFAGYDINLLGYVRANWLAILGIEVALGCGLSAVSSLLAIGRYLRV